MRSLISQTVTIKQASAGLKNIYMAKKKPVLTIAALNPDNAEVSESKLKSFYMKSRQRLINVNADDSPAPGPWLRYYCVVTPNSFESQL